MSPGRVAQVGRDHRIVRVASRHAVPHPRPSRVPRTGLLPTALLTVLLTACSGISDTTTPGADDGGTTTPDRTDRAAPTPAAPTATTTEGVANGAAGGALTITAWNVTFTLPDTILSGDVTFLDHTGDGDGFVDLRSATLEDALDTEACGGTSVEQGQFAQIARAEGESAEDEDDVAVGEHVYEVRVNTDLATCYPSDLVQRYLSEDVAVAIRESLTAS